MKILAVATTLIWIHPANAFAPQFGGRLSSTKLRSTEFNEALLEDMQACLFKLEKRVKEGPGSLTLLEVDEFTSASSRILQDMKQQSVALPERLGPGARKAAAEAAAARAAEAADMAGLGKEEIEAQARAAYNKVQQGKEIVEIPSTTHAPPPPPPPPTQQQAAPVEDIPVVKTTEVADTSNDEGPAYDGTGGLGLAKETINTYVIDGMDEMSPEEYQEAMRQRIIRTQKHRRVSGGVGNRSSLDYMNFLNGNTADRDED
mmetsp:Transcript_1685/g.2955  ORF Transcript_1685/g.2955 Transcript_1685/m.2955 type:complete len:260 (-) Transcript_1685:1204-1983(-)